MRRLKLGLLVSLLPTSLFAQGLAPKPELMLKYFEGQRNDAMNNGAACLAIVEDLQKQLAEAKKKIEELSKTEEKKE